MKRSFNFEFMTMPRVLCGRQLKMLHVREKSEMVRVIENWFANGICWEYF